MSRVECNIISKVFLKTIQQISPLSKVYLVRLKFEYYLS